MLSFAMSKAKAALVMQHELAMVRCSIPSRGLQRKLSTQCQTSTVHDKRTAASTKAHRVERLRQRGRKRKRERARVCMDYHRFSRRRGASTPAFHGLSLHPEHHNLALKSLCLKTVRSMPSSVRRCQFWAQDSSGCPAPPPLHSLLPPTSDSPPTSPASGKKP